MASGMSMEDSPMEELVDQGLGMEETGLRRPSFRETYHHDSLLAPDTDFMIDFWDGQFVCSYYDDLWLPPEGA
ncbi:unnamed protein product [Coregonus sp. 'balchen']|nr:unnamed protein product [Coregonus sp. 'balchen']